MGSRFEAVDARFEKIEGRLDTLDGSMGEIKAMLLSLGATASPN